MKKKSPSRLTPFAIVLISLGALLCLSGFLISYVICIDRISDIFITWSDKSGWVYKGGYSYQGKRIWGNSWVPFYKELTGFRFLDCLMQLPKALYESFVYFPTSSFLALLFFPLVIILIPIYDAVFLKYYLIHINGILPFCAGLGIMLYACFYGDFKRLPKEKRPDLDHF